MSLKKGLKIRTLRLTLKIHVFIKWKACRWKNGNIWASHWSTVANLAVVLMTLWANTVAPSTLCFVLMVGQATLSCYAFWKPTAFLFCHTPLRKSMLRIGNNWAKCAQRITRYFASYSTILIENNKSNKIQKQQHQQQQRPQQQDSKTTITPTKTITTRR